MFERGKVAVIAKVTIASRVVKIEFKVTTVINLSTLKCFKRDSMVLISTF